MITLLAVALLQTASAAPAGLTVAEKGPAAGGSPCTTCHGLDGAGNAVAGFPVLAGLDEAYLRHQLTAIRDGERPAAAMAPLVTGMTDAEIAAVSAYYAGLPAPAPAALALDETASARAADIVAHGDWPGRDLPGCVSCHGPGARGVNATFPRLAGQHAAYIEAQLRAWQRGDRKTDPGDLMGTVARKLTTDEVQAISAWLAAQPAEAP